MVGASATTTEATKVWICPTSKINRVGFSFVYAPASPPQHPDFEVAWTDSLDWQQNGHLLRCVFVASRNEIANRKLLSLFDGSEAGPQADHPEALGTDGAPSDPELP